MNDFHATSQTDLPIRLQILNISVNMARISRLVSSSFETNQNLISKFLHQTELYLNGITSEQVSPEFQPTLNKFKQEFSKLKGNLHKVDERSEWIERALTWSDILQIRSSLV